MFLFLFEKLPFIHFFHIIIYYFSVHFNQQQLQVHFEYITHKFIHNTVLHIHTVSRTPMTNKIVWSLHFIKSVTECQVVYSILIKFSSILVYSVQLIRFVEKNVTQVTFCKENQYTELTNMSQ